MSKIKIVESVTGRVENVHSYADLEHHHPSKHLHESGRVYATVDGKREEVAGDYNGHIVRTQNGNLMVSKDLVLQNADNIKLGVRVPAPASGYIGGVNARNGTVEIYDRPGGEMIARIRHMDLSNFTLKNGDQIIYGEPMGTQSGYGKGIADFYGVHTHIDYNAQYLDQFKKYVIDIDTGVINTTSQPLRSPNLIRPAPLAGSAPIAPLADGVLEQGERGAAVTALQEQLIRLKFTDAQGHTLTPDGDFGARTKEAVKAFQSAHHLTDDGIVGKDTFAALRQVVPSVQASASATTVVTGAVGTTTLSNLIGSGEGSYNSYNRGVAGDSRAPFNLSDMTVSEIMRRQDLPKSDQGHLFAVGKFQIIPSTMEAAVRNLGLNGGERFTPALQEQMFADYLIDEKRPAVKAYIIGNSAGADGLGRAQLELSKEFASVANPNTGRSYFENDSGGNHSSISGRQVETALNQMRTQYQANIAKGQSPDAAYRALNGQGQTQAPSIPTHTQTHAATSSSALADGMLRQGEQGPDVKKLQEQLNALHFKDKNGNALVSDGDFGKHTKEAVKAFQKAHHLDDDGIVGKETLAALKKAGATVVAAPPTAPAKTDQSPLLSNPNHPDHKLYQQALAGMEKLPPTTFKNEQERQNAAAAVTFEAKVSGLTKIDTVALSTNGSGLFAVQGAMNDPGHSRIYVDKAQAAAQTVEKSTQQLQQDNLFPVQPAQNNDTQRRVGVSLG